MSVPVMGLVWESDVSAADGRIVLLALADNANDAGRCWPGTAYLAGKCCISRSTVFRLLRKLESQSLISREQRTRSNGSQTSNVYRMNLAELRCRKRTLTAEEKAELEDDGFDQGGQAPRVNLTLVAE